ncbi:hypothetical protein Tco_1540623 [Tanacetum coccineum]
MCISLVTLASYNSSILIMFWNLSYAESSSSLAQNKQPQTPLAILASWKLKRCLSGIVQRGNLLRAFALFSFALTTIEVFGEEVTDEAGGWFSLQTS